MEKTNAVVYARVSTNNEDQLHSMKSQRDYYSKYAVASGYNLLKVYADEGLSATSSNRKEFLAMLTDAGLDPIKDKFSNNVSFRVNYEKEPLFKWIIVKDVSRFARNVSAIDIARLLRDDKGVYIDFENLGFTTKDTDWEFRTSLFLTFSQQESIDRSIKSKKAYDIKAKKGDYHMSNVLLGYKRNPETKKYEINEEEAEIIRYIFDQYVNEGKGTTEISDLCNQKGYKTKKGRRFTGNSVLRIIKNEKFKGQVITNRFTHTGITGSYKRYERPKEEWEIHENAIPNIIPSVMFDKAQEIRNQRAINTKNFGKKGKKVPKSELYMKIYCGKCNSDYVRVGTQKVRKYETSMEYFYSCRHRRYRTRTEQTCDNRGVSHNVLVRELTKIGDRLHERFNDLRISDEEMALNVVLRELDEKLENSNAEKNDIIKKIDKLDIQLENVAASIAEGVSESVRKVMHKKIDEIEADKARLETSMLEFDTITIEKKKQEYIYKYEDIYNFSRKKKYTYNDVVELLDGIYILPNRTAIVEINTPTLLSDPYVIKGKKDKALLPFTFDLS